MDVQARYEFRIFDLDLDPFIEKLEKECAREQTRKMNSIYLLTHGNIKNNIKIRDGVMDIKTLEKTYGDLEQWNPFLVGAFPLQADVIKTVVFPALGIESPVFERKTYSLEQFLSEIIAPDPDLSVAHVKKIRHGYTLNNCLIDLADIIVNGAFIRTFCIESKDPEKLMETRKILGMDDSLENQNYPLALKRIMGLAEFPQN